MLRFFIILSLSLLTNYSFASSIDLVLKSKVATSLNEVNIYPDSTYETQSMQRFPAGTLLEVLDETVSEHEDGAQNQKFKWYRVKSLQGKEGWVFGDGIAVVTPTERVDAKLKGFHKRKYDFGDGFGKSILWIGGIEGRDNFHEKDYLNPLYNEYYVVLTNDQGQCVFVNCASETTRGKTTLRYIELLDTTSDKIPELLIQTSSVTSDSEHFENRNFEIYSFQSGRFNRIFEERMSLRYKNNIHSPALFKHIEVDKDIIRVAYVDFMNCRSYKLKNDFGTFKDQKERCIEYVTYTYVWSDRTKQYKMIYDESRTAPVVGTRRGNVSLLDEPSVFGKNLNVLDRTARLEIIKVHDKNVKGLSSEKTVPYFYVKLKDGTKGFVPANQVGFTDIEHAVLLNQYYGQPAAPDLKTWKSKTPFLKIIGDNRSSFTSH